MRLLFSSCLLLVLLFEYGNGDNPCVDKNAKSCSECMQVAGCGWCEQPEYANNPNLVISRCDLPKNLKAGKCPDEFILNPPSSVNNTVDDPHSSVGSSDVGKATQLKPQKIDAKLRPGSPAQIQISYKQAEDYPVDLYYLLDLSNSMKDDLDSLRELGKELGDRMSSITRDFRLGFGSFVDKTVMPYISMVPKRRLNPCTDNKPCQPTYTFSNELPLTKDIDEFVRSVKSVNHSSNLDSPEGGFDAMMQAIVCEDFIKWRKEATHLLVYVTDAGFHYAGDGKLGGIVAPNDGHCYLDGRGQYYKANEMDYPSVGHLVQKINDFNIQPIFAVTKEVITTYKKLQDLIPKSAVGELTADSSNIIDLIQDAYNALKDTVVLGVELPEGVEVMDKKSHCLTGTREGLECDGVKIGDVVNFTMSIKTNECFTGTKKMKINIFGYNEEVEVDISTLCECQCSEDFTPLNNCSGNGAYECGACVCKPDYLGLDCSCDKKDLTSTESYLDNCTQPDSKVVCSGRGECICGQCICKQSPERKIDGQYCQCDNTSCDRIDGKVCNGHGTCDCRACVCDEGWSGKACECTADKSGCIDQNSPDSGYCHGAGKCECGKCTCNVTKSGFEYRGQFCEISPQQLCTLHRECVQCLAYGNRKEFEKNATLCDHCKQYNITYLNGGSSMHRGSCQEVDEYNDCTFWFWYNKDGDIIQIDTDPDTQVCPVYANPMYIIIGIIAAIVGIGLAILLIWKLLTSIKDAREYKQWQKEVQGAKWESGGNPIFQSATSTFQNPTYKGGKPSSQL
uniref:integrin beta-1-B-like n=1 Tax=Styela clava TaxID=7725 RepID=UPI00193A57BF|nr:integrin beta-1-B-like [Styela clava]